MIWQLLVLAVFLITAVGAVWIVIVASPSGRSAAAKAFAIIFAVTFVAFIGRWVT